MCGIGVARRRTSLHQNILSLEYWSLDYLWRRTVWNAPKAPNPLPQASLNFSSDLILGCPQLPPPRGDANGMGYHFMRTIIFKDCFSPRRWAVLQQCNSCDIFIFYERYFYLKQEAQLLLGWPTVLPYSRRLCKSCGAFVQIGPAVFSWCCWQRN